MYYNFHGEGGRFLASSYYIDHKGVYFKGCGLFEWIRLWSQISVSLLHSLYQVKNFCNVALAFVILILNIFGYAHDGNIPRLQTIVYLGTPVGPSPLLAYLCAPVCADLHGRRGSEPGSLVNISFSVSETVIGLRVSCQSGVREDISVSWKIISSKYKFICFDMYKIMSSYCFNFLYICNVTIFMSHFVMFTFFFALEEWLICLLFFMKSPVYLFYNVLFPNFLISTLVFPPNFLYKFFQLFQYDA